VVDGSEAFTASPLVNQVGEEAAPFFDVWAVPVPSEMKRALDELFEHAESPFKGK